MDTFKEGSLENIENTCPKDKTILKHTSLRKDNTKEEVVQEKSGDGKKCKERKAGRPKTEEMRHRFRLKET